MTRGKHTDKSAARFSRAKVGSRQHEAAQKAAQRNSAWVSQGASDSNRPRPAPPCPFIASRKTGLAVLWFGEIGKWVFLNYSASEASHWLDGDTWKEWDTMSNLDKKLLGKLTNHVYPLMRNNKVIRG